MQEATHSVAPALLTRKNFKDLTGKKFGRLTITSYAGMKGGYSHWNCECECGTRIVAESYNIRCGNTNSCGCWKREIASIANTTHGCAKRGKLTPEFRSWIKMIERCTDTKCKAYPGYGGRGITICDEWLDSFEAFHADMGDKPTPRYQIERIDNNDGYYKENCRWATPLEQGRNKRNNVHLTLNGVTLCLSEWSRITGMEATKIRYRMKRGWPDHLALSVTG